MSTTDTMSNSDKTDETEEERVLINGEHAEYLSTDGYQASDRGCNRPEGDCDGVFWFDTHELVCSVCGYVVDMAEKKRRSSIERKSVRGLWSDFWSERPEYYTSGKKRCPGGFLEPYDWVTSEDAEGTVRSVSADDFYR